MKLEPGVVITVSNDKCTTQELCHHFVAYMNETFGPDKYKVWTDRVMVADVTEVPPLSTGETVWDAIIDTMFGLLNDEGDSFGLNFNLINADTTNEDGSHQYGWVKNEEVQETT